MENEHKVDHIIISKRKKNKQREICKKDQKINKTASEILRSNLTVEHKHLQNLVPIENI